MFKCFKPLFCVIDFVPHLSLYFDVLQMLGVFIPDVEPIVRRQVSAEEGRKKETYFTFVYFDR